MHEDRKNPAAAFFLSVIPGAGHLYAGRIVSAIVWLIVLVGLYNNTPPLAVIMHFFCALSAVKAVSAANRAERRSLSGRTESADEFARMVDRAAPRDPPESRDDDDAGGSTDDPPPRLVRGAFTASPGLLLEALRASMERHSFRVAKVDTQRMRVLARVDLDGATNAAVVAQVEATPAGSRVRMLLDRPAGSRRDPEADDRTLRGVLEYTENIIARGGDSDEAADVPSGEDAGDGVTEVEFLEDLREAWEAREQGWMPEGEWVDRKAELIRELLLRPDTLPDQFALVCRPLADAGVLTDEDMRAIERALG